MSSIIEPVNRTAQTPGPVVVYHGRDMGGLVLAGMLVVFVALMLAAVLVSRSLLKATAAP